MTDDLTFEQVADSATNHYIYPGSDVDRDRLLDTAMYRTQVSETEVTRTVQLFVSKAPPSITGEYDIQFMLEAFDRDDVGFKRYTYGVTADGEIVSPIGGSPSYYLIPPVVREPLEDWRPAWLSAIERERRRSQSLWKRLRDRLISTFSDPDDSVQ